MDYKNCTCSSCHKPLHEGDDIVVCPQCGAPYHRACYAKEGKCVFESRHNAGFAFEPPETKDTGMRCPACGAANEADNLFCERCGHPLGAAANPPTGGRHGWANAPQGDTGEGAYRPHGFAGGPTAFGGMGFSPSGPAPAYNGINTSLWRAYIGRSAPYYLYQFSRMDAQQRKTSICWSALLFGPLYFLYRRMWGLGALLFAASLAFSLPSYLLVFQRAGVAFWPAISEDVLLGAGWVCFLLNCAVSIYFALYAFTLYRQHGAKRLQQLQRQAEAAGRDAETLALRRGGPSVLGVIGLLAVRVGIGLLLQAWIGPAQLLAALYG